MSADDACRHCHHATGHERWCVTMGAEHEDPVKWCRAPLCADTNWGGYGRLHYRGSECPPYDPNPEPNEMADFWETIREMARENGRKNRASNQMEGSE